MNPMRMNRILRAALAILLALTLSPAAPGGGGATDLTRETDARLASTPPGGPLTSEQAAALALNDLQAAPGGYHLDHPRYGADFTPGGLALAPRRSELRWRWRLSYAGPAGKRAGGAALAAVRPVNGAAGRVEYPRPGLVEQYLLGQNSIEQQFILSGPPDLEGGDFEIAGTVESAGAFSAQDGAWQWQLGEHTVRLGGVRAFDAAGSEIPAEMQVTAGETRITLEGTALARAAYPVTVDPEIGTDDFRISDMGLVNDAIADVSSPPDVAYNFHHNEYLVVWSGDNVSGSLADGELEIWGQRLSGDGVKLGTEIRISYMGPDGSPAYTAFTPAVVCNPTTDEYLVVWAGEHDAGALVDGEFEIFGQRLDASDGALAGAYFRISDMGPDGVSDYDAFRPAQAYNPETAEYLVVWEGDDDTGALVNDESEIFAQRLNAVTGAEIGGDFRISDMGPDGDDDFDAYNADVVYNATNNHYLVVWEGDDGSGALVDNEFEIYGQRLDAGGALVGTNDARLSEMGGSGDVNYQAYEPAAAFNLTDNRYLVVWSGDDNTPPLVNEEFEIFGQMLNADTGSGVGPNDFRISDMGPDGSSLYDAYSPAAAYNGLNNEFLVTWHGDDNIAPLVENEHEIFGQRLIAASGAQTGANDFRISDMGADGMSVYLAGNAAVAYRGNGNEYLVVWRGDDDSPSLAGGTDSLGTPDYSPADGAAGGTDSLGTPDYSPADGAAGGTDPTRTPALDTADGAMAPEVNEEYEIYGQRLAAASGAETGNNDFRISVMGPDMRVLFDGLNPAVVFNPALNQYLVVWSGDTLSEGDGATEIFGRRLDAASGGRLGGMIRISDMGPNGNAAYTANNPAAVYNSVNHEYLVVWHGEDDIAPLVDGEYEIFGQRLDAVTGAQIGVNDFRISDMGSNGSPLYVAFSPDAAYNPVNNEYLVVWSGDDNIPPLADNEYEIFGQRLDAASGVQTGANDFRISDMGPDGSPAYNAYNPAAVYHPSYHQFLVVWEGDDNSGALVDNETEIYGQRLNAATGVEVGGDFRISDMGPDGSSLYGGFQPAAAANPVDNEYLVVWEGDDNRGSLVDNEPEIFGQRLSAADGSEVGANDFRISDMGSDGSTQYWAEHPAVAYNAANHQYLVAWFGDDNIAPLMDNKIEIFGQLLNAATGSALGQNDFRLSRMGADTDFASEANLPAAAANPEAKEWLVVWTGTEDEYPLIAGQYEIFGQRYAAGGLYLPLVVHR